MSGIVGIWNRDGAAVDRQLLHRLTDYLAFRGSDAQRVWSDGQVGFGHTLLATTDEAQQEQQPCTLDGQVWITADARIDARKELIAKLEGKGRALPKTPTDVELILHAYHAWGQDCVQHLLGDFAFAIWDGRERRLFCARDHFGVKPFYYAEVGETLFISNTLNCLRLCPGVTATLNELAIGDFLLFGFNHEPATTTFADIQRVPPAHVLTSSASGVKIRRYWTLPTDGEIRYRRKQDYVEHFGEVIRAAVEDRLRMDRVGVSMSGGLDSSSIAGFARELLAKRGGSVDLRAFTCVYDRLIPDEERHYSGLVAKALDIPIHYQVADDYQPFQRPAQATWNPPEPLDDPLVAMSLDQLDLMTAHGRVVLSGEGGDAIFRASTQYLLDLLKKFSVGGWLREVLPFVCTHGRLPPLGWRSRLKSWLGFKAWQPAFPTWLNQEFTARNNLRERMALANAKQPPTHPTHAEAYSILQLPGWAGRFEILDPGTTGRSVEFRHPYFDLRVLRFVLAVPPVPWCVDKELLRESVRCVLPEVVRRRAKAVLPGDPFGEALRTSGIVLADLWKPGYGIEDYVGSEYIACLAESLQTKDSDETQRLTRPLVLQSWLTDLISFASQSAKEHRYEFA